MTEKTMKLEIAAPEGIFYSGQAELVELNTTEGQIGVYPGHIPMTMVAAPGILTITEPEGKKRASLTAGFLEIQQEQITILTEKIQWM